MILEGIVTTLDDTGSLNIAPMGPRMEPDFRRFVLRPFRTSTTYKNLRLHGEGVLHVTDDVLLFARSTIGSVSDAFTRPAERVRGQILLDCCRYYEFRVTDTDEREERAAFHAETVHQGRFRDFFGFNRARHAVLEMAILASRIEFLSIDDLGDELKKLQLAVQKTGGPRESDAFELLKSHMINITSRRGLDLGSFT